MASFHFIKLVQVIFFTIVCLVTQSCQTLCNLVCVCVCACVRVCVCNFLSPSSTLQHPLW